MNNNIQLLHNVTIQLHACRKKKENKNSYSFLLLCVPCQEITQDCTQSLLRNHLHHIEHVTLHILYGGPLRSVSLLAIGGPPGQFLRFLYGVLLIFLKITR